MILRENLVEMKLCFPIDNKHCWDNITVLEGKFKNPHSQNKVYCKVVCIMSVMEILFMVIATFLADNRQVLK